MPVFRVESYPDEEDQTVVRTFTADGFVIDEEQLLFVNGTEGEVLTVVAACASGWRFVERIAGGPTSAEIEAGLSSIADQLSIPGVPVAPTFLEPKRSEDDQ